MLICSRCGHKNQLGHIFCSRCYTKLDLSRLSDPQLLKERTANTRQWLRLILIIAGLLTLMLVLALWSLPMMPQRTSSADLQQAHRKIALLERGGAVLPMVFSEAEVNACLARALQAQRKTRGASLRSVQAQLKPNAIVLSMVTTRKLPAAAGGRPKQLDISYAVTGVPEIGPEGFRFIVYRGMIGHLPLPGPFGRVLIWSAKDYFRSLRQNYPLLSDFKRLELEQGKITVYF